MSAQHSNNPNTISFKRMNNNALHDFGESKSIPLMFQESVNKYSSNIACRLDDISLTYLQLHNRVVQLSQLLINKYNIKQGSYIGQCVDRSIDMLIGILSIMSIGCIYVPLNPQDPIDRLTFLINDINTSIILTQSHLHNKLIESTNKAINNTNNKDTISIVLLDKIEYKSNNNLLNNNKLPLVNIDSNSVAYVIYTSGSTGEPKGAQLTHANYYNFIRSLYYNNYIHETDCMMQTASCTFDAHMTEIIGPICIGGIVCLIKPLGNLDIEYYINCIYNYKVNVAVWVPAFALQLLQYTIDNNNYNKLLSLRSVHVGGEAITYNLISLIYICFINNNVNHNIELINVYGPAEVTCIATTHKFDLINYKHKYINNSIPIGQPLCNYQVFVINSKSNQLVAPGSIGELYVGGLGVFRGYLNKPELTSKSLVNLPHISNNKLYRTGDLVKMNDAGELIFIGRADYQVKIRGQRLEVGEIENIINQYNGIKQSIVIKITDINNNNNEYLAAYIKIDNNEYKSLDDNKSIELRKSIYNHCKSKLINYMVPTCYVLLFEYPLNNNGKIDRKLLPQPSAIDLASADSNVNGGCEPSNPTERELQIIFAGLLNRSDDVASIPCNQPLTRYGLSSLMLMSALNKIRQKFNIPGLSVGILFKAESIRDLANSIQIETAAESKLELDQPSPIAVSINIDYPDTPDTFFEDPSTPSSLRPLSIPNSPRSAGIVGPGRSIMDSSVINIEHNVIPPVSSIKNLLFTLSQLFGILFIWINFVAALAISSYIIEYIPSYISLTTLLPDTNTFGWLHYTISFLIYILISYIVLLIMTIIWRPLLIGWPSPGTYNCRSFQHWRWWLFQSLWFSFRPYLQPLMGTNLYVIYLKLLGMKIGSNVEIYTLFIDMPWLVSIGDNTFISHLVRFQCATFSSRIVKFAKISIGSNCVINERTVIHGDTSMGHNCYIDPFSFVSSGTVPLEPNSFWSGHKRIPTTASPQIGKGYMSKNILKHLFQSVILLFCTFLSALPVGVARFIFELYITTDIIYFYASTPLLYVFYSIATTLVMIPIYRIFTIGSSSMIAKLTKGKGIQVNSWSWIFYCWMNECLLIFTDRGLNFVSHTILQRWCLRLMGMNSGKCVDIAGPIGGYFHVPLQLLDFKDNVFLASENSIGSFRIVNGYYKPQFITIQSNTFIGNNSICESSLLNNNLIGSLTVIPPIPNSSQPPLFPSDSTVLGNPPLILPIRMPSLIDGDQPYSEFGRILMHSFGILIAYLTFAISFVPAVIAIYYALIYIPNLPSTILSISIIYYLAPIGLMIFSFFLGLFTIILKYIIVGRFKQGEYNYAGSMFFRRDFVGQIDAIYYSYVGSMLLHSPLNNIFHRCMGSSIGRNSLIAGKILEYDLVSIDDECVLEEGGQIQPHTFENRLLKMNNISIDKFCWLGSHCMIFPGVKIERQVCIEANTLIMKNDSLPANSTWAGNPAVRTNRNNFKDARVSVITVNNKNNSVVPVRSANKGAVSPTNNIAFHWEPSITNPSHNQNLQSSTYQPIELLPLPEHPSHLEI